MTTQLLDDQFGAVSAATSASDLLSLLVTFGQKLGFGRVTAYTTMRQPATARWDVQFVHNYPESWQQQCRNEELIARDPIIKHASSSNLPLVWDKQYFEKSGCRDLWDFYKNAGFDSGINISMRDRSGNGYRIGLSSSEALPPDPRAISALVADVQLFGAYAQAAMARIWLPQREQGPRALTGRELECLKWTSEGKTAWELGQILGISERTANFHLTNATQKLGCSNKFAAVIEAFRSGLLR